MALLLVNLLINQRHHAIDHVSHHLFYGILDLFLNDHFDFVVLVIVFEFAGCRPSFFGTFFEGSIAVDAYRALDWVP